MNAMIMSALAVVGISGFFSVAQSDPKNATEGCCAKSAEDQGGKKKDGCCETKTATCCVKNDTCCDAKATEPKQGHPSNHCVPEKKPKASGSDLEGSKAPDKHEHNHQRMVDTEKAGACGGCMK